MAANDDSFKFEYGADFPEGLDILSMEIQKRKLGKNFSPIELITELNMAAEYKERTARRAGKGKRLEPNKFEGEQETESRKRAQADCQRLILPKGKDEIPDVFIRRLDAHRTAQEALIVPLTPPETNTDFIMRVVAVKGNEEPNTVILPKSPQEGEAEFKSRMEVAKATPALVFPRGKSETADHFKLRLSNQAKQKTSILPKAVDESDKHFKRRVETYAMFSIHPFDPSREDEDLFDRRMRHHKEVPQVPCEPGDMDLLKKFPSETVRLEREAAEAEKLKAALEKQAEKDRLEAEAAEKEAAEKEERMKAAKGNKRTDSLDDGPAPTREEQEERVKAAIAAQKKAAEEKVLADAAAAAKAMADLAMTEDTVDFNKIGFMPLKKLLMEKGVPKDAVFSAANKMALKEIAMKHNVKINFVES
uniref:Uncharacterized protein n=1 Tax=Haptolina ericina TaxID=156174 RepID=A0A7S3ATI9_9EUKA